MPCSYKEFKIVGEPAEVKNANHTILYMIMASTDVLEKQEELIYPFLSLVAEFGGSLGLFLGFSFMTVFDFVIGYVKENF